MANFEDIKSELLKSGKLFEDEDFPASEKSLPKFMGTIQPSEVVWLRPKVIYLLFKYLFHNLQYKKQINHKEV